MEQKQVDAIQNIDKEPLLSNQQTVAHQPEIFVIDFKGVYPQFTQDNKPMLVVSHKVIHLNPYTAKDFFNILKDNIEKFEKKFGEIKKPEQVQKAEKEARDMQKQTFTSTEKPSYMG